LPLSKKKKVNEPIPPSAGRENQVNPLITVLTDVYTIRQGVVVEGSF